MLSELNVLGYTGREKMASWWPNTRETLLLVQLIYFPAVSLQLLSLYVFKLPYCLTSFPKCPMKFGLLKNLRCSSCTITLSIWRRAERALSVSESQPLVEPVRLVSLHVSCLPLTVSVVPQQAFNGSPTATLGRL